MKQPSVGGALQLSDTVGGGGGDLVGNVYTIQSFGHSLMGSPYGKYSRVAFPPFCL